MIIRPHTQLVGKVDARSESSWGKIFFVCRMSKSSVDGWNLLAWASPKYQIYPIIIEMNGWYERDMRHIPSKDRTISIKGAFL